MTDQRGSFTIPDQQCPGCGLMIGGARGLDGDDLPARGDAALCAHCGALSVFDRCDAGHLLRRPPTPDERRVFATDETLMAHQRALRSVYARRSKARWN